MRRLHAFVFCLSTLFFVARCSAQQTIFNVPSADVLKKGQIYGEFDDSTYFAQQSTEFEPRIVFGVGHNIEAGLNLPYITEPGLTSTTAISPTVKWKFYDNSSNGWALFGGLHLFFPVHLRTYDVGDYLYIEAAKTFHTSTRVGLGIYDYTHGVVAPGNRGGVQASIEQPVTKKLKAQADWFSGSSEVGYLATGVSYSATSKTTLYGAYEFGNSGIVRDNNHALLIEIGYNFR